MFGTRAQWQPTGKICTGHNLLKSLPLRFCDGTQLFRCWFSYSKAIKPWREKKGAAAKRWAGWTGYYTSCAEEKLNLHNDADSQQQQKQGES